MSVGIAIASPAIVVKSAMAMPSENTAVSPTPPPAGIVDTLTSP